MDEPDETSLKLSICRFLMRHSTLSLATCNGNQPWSTDLFYASDRSCQLYFVSNGTTRHCQHIANKPQVSVSVSGEFDDWGPIKGLQLDGMANIVFESERDAVIEMYLAKFPSLQKIYQEPANEQERQIITRLMEGDFYRISPRWVRLIDNSKGFGHKEEMIF